MQYKSDVPSNRSLVRSTFLDETGELYESENKVINQGYRDALELLAMSEDPKLSKQLISFAVERVIYLAMWKVWTDPMEWQNFLMKLTQNKVPIRIIAAVKQTIDAQFCVYLNDAELEREAQRDLKRSVIEGVKAFTARRDKSGGIILEIELI